jgi:hypothetical protein
MGKRNKVLIVIMLVAFALPFSNCKKFPEGGSKRKAAKHLRDGFSGVRRWNVTLYQVNGVDSTSSYKSGDRNSNDGRRGYDVRIAGPWYSKKIFVIDTQGWTFDVTLTESRSVLLMTHILGPDSAITCFSQKVCERNIFNPETEFDRTTEWSILRLTDTEMVLEYRGANSYRIGMEVTDEV